MKKGIRSVLEAYRSNRQEIMELKKIIKDRWKNEELIGNDVIMDYSKGYPMPQSVVGFDQRRYKYLQERDQGRVERLEKECRMAEDFIDDIPDTIERRIFRMYYLDGVTAVTQSQVAKRVHMDQCTISRKINKFLKDA